jgi:hypothetical protein
MERSSQGKPSWIKPAGSRQLKGYAANKTSKTLGVQFPKSRYRGRPFRGNKRHH